MNARVINVFRDSRDFILAEVLAESNSQREIAWPAIFLSFNSVGLLQLICS